MQKPLRPKNHLVFSAALLVAALIAACSGSCPPEAADAGPVDGCDQHSVPGAPCVDDSACVATSPCETAACDLAVGRCVVSDGLPDGEACDDRGGVCKQRLCCRGIALSP